MFRILFRKKLKNTITATSATQNVSRFLKNSAVICFLSRTKLTTYMSRILVGILIVSGILVAAEFSCFLFFHSFFYEDQQSSTIEPWKNSSKLTFCYTSMQSPKTTQKHTLLASEPVFSLGSHYSQSYVRKTFFFQSDKNST